MALSPKLELLGQVSERARELEVEHLVGSPAREIDLAEAMHMVRLARLERVPWENRRAALVDMLAAGLNAIMAGDADARHGAEVG